MNHEIIYRPLNSGDAEALFSLTANENIAKYMRFDTHTNILQAKLLLQEYLLETAFALEIDDKFAGVFVLKKGENSCFSMSVFLGQCYWNQGYSSAALCYMKEYATMCLGAKSLEAYVVADNIGSCKALVKNGFLEKERLYFDDLPCGLIVYEWH